MKSFIISIHFRIVYPPVHSCSFLYFSFFIFLYLLFILSCSILSGAICLNIRERKNVREAEREKESEGLAVIVHRGCRLERNGKITLD